MSGFEAVIFRCPVCKGNKWGTRGTVGICNGRRAGGAACDFAWSRRFDYSVFFRVDGGAGFANALELEQLVGMRTAAPTVVAVSGGVVRLCARGDRATLPELLHDLLGDLMECPPTVGVVERWTPNERRLALDWAMRVIFSEDLRVPRPAFIEAGAATA